MLKTLKPAAIMKPTSLLVGIQALALLAAPSLAQDSRPPITEERIQEAYREAAAALEKHLGRELEALPPISIVQPEAVAPVIESENLPIFRRRHPGDPDRAAADAKTVGELFGSVVIAKYSWSSKEILVVKRNWERTAALVPSLRITDDQALRAILIHELVHADDDQVYDLTKLLEKGDSIESVDAINALIEGHAQFVSRAACATAGWSDGFERFTQSIGAHPLGEGAGEALQSLADVQSFASRFPYVEGERFVTAVDSASGAAGRARLFESPPRELELIAVPGWYIDPDSRPEVLYDMEPVLASFIEGFDKTVWSSQRVELNPAQIAAGLSLLEPEDVTRISESTRGALVAQVYPTANPQLKIAICAALEFNTAEDARHFITQSAELNNRKDEAMREGVLRITKSRSVPVNLPNGSGWIFEKEMMNGGYRFSLLSATFRRGKIVVELTFSGDPPSADVAKDLGNTLLLEPVLVK